jgi:dTDP-4-amino-4,6-dideoxygalactose transaminase
MDPNLVADTIKEMKAAGHLPAAVVPTDLYGQSSDVDALRSICDPEGIPLVVDSAEALGATYRGQPAGKRGRAAIFSFNGNKIITTSGGGMLATDDEQAREPFLHYEHEEVGYNYRMSNVLAGIGIGQLEVLPDRVNRKRAIFERYVAELGGLPGVSFMPEADYGRSTRWLTVALVDSGKFGATPNEIIAALDAENIESRPVWKPMHMQPAFAGCSTAGGAISERFFRDGICLPSGTLMTDEQQLRVCTIFHKMAK